MALKKLLTVAFDDVLIMKINCIYENLLVVASLEKDGKVSKVSLAKPHDKSEIVSDLTREQVYTYINNQHDSRISDWDTEIKTTKFISESIKEEMKDIVIVLNNNKVNSFKKERLNKLYNSLSRELKVYIKRLVTAEERLYELKEFGAAGSFQYPVGYWDI